MSKNLGRLILTNAEEATVWLKAFDAECRFKQIADDSSNRKKTDYWMASCGIECLGKVETLTQS